MLKLGRFDFTTSFNRTQCLCTGFVLRLPIKNREWIGRGGPLTRKWYMNLTDITSEELNNLPLKHFEGDILLIEDPEDIEEIVPLLKKEKHLGFDTETKPSFKKGEINKVSLLQLSTNKKAFLIRLNKTGLPLSLTQILTDKEIIKIGVAVKDDIKSLQKLNPFKPQGFIELQDYVKQFNIESNGLKKLSGIVLNIKISKSQQLSNWEQDVLTEAQQRYAATDAWVCLKIFGKLKNYK